MYNAPITRENPTAIVVLVDRSGSMAENVVFSGAVMSKARAVSFVVGDFIDELLHRARRSSGVGDYYDIAVLGYSGAGVEPLLSKQGEFTKPSRLAGQSVRRESLSQERPLPDGGSVVALTEHNIWIEPLAEGMTPMCAALGMAAKLVEKWCRKPAHAANYPPTVINITDGEVSDGSDDDVRAAARKICATATSDGQTLLVNVALSHNEDDRAVLFPASVDELPVHRYAGLLWEISSTAPFLPAGRLVGYNSDMSALARAMNVGSLNTTII